MSAEPSAENVPPWDVADRMRKSLREAHIGVSDMADYLEVGRNTVSNWINGRTTPPGAALRLWAQRCNVSLEWLKSGVSELVRPTEPGATGNAPRQYSDALGLAA